MLCKGDPEMARKLPASEDHRASPIVRFERVTKAYRFGQTRVTALRGVDLAVDRGEFVAIWGPSGSGKSTLCNLAGLLDAPTEGAVWLNGKDAALYSDDQKSRLRNAHIGFVFQGFNLMPVLSALENIMLPLQIFGIDASAARQKAMACLAEVHMTPYATHRPARLSGGQQQRVAICRALITNPDIVIADEPTANLDSAAAKMIIDLMAEMNATRGTTFIFSTHDRRVIENVRRKVLLTDGRIEDDVIV
jgi:putative ABC transport system ATP-binding protein